MVEKDAMVEELTRVLDKVAGKSRFRSGGRRCRTGRVIRAPCRWGLRRGYHVYAKGVGRGLKRRNPGRVDGEWLYDVTCLRYGDDEYLKEVPLVVESEWGDEHEIFDDFEKLLLCRADLRLMIFNRDVQPARPGERSERRLSNLRPSANPGGAIRTTREPVRAPVSGRTDGTALGTLPSALRAGG